MLEQASFVSIGNAASPTSEILPIEMGMRRLLSNDVWKIIRSDWWNAVDGSKRIIMAECLIAGAVPPDEIHTIYVADHQTAERVRSLPLSAAKINVVQEPHFFFQPRRIGRVSATLFWVDGDMFFSHMQTLTISVNTVGVMGKGLASRAKYQFPDVYVVYQDVCRSRKLDLGKPYLYKRERPLEEELADEPFHSSNGNKWFLLFPTKRHWKERSEIANIEKGL